MRGIKELRMTIGGRGERSRLSLVAVTAGLLALAACLWAGQAKAAYEFEFADFSGSAFDSAGQVTQAAAHPELTTTFKITHNSAGGPGANLHDVKVGFPPGLIINPSSVSNCPSADVAGVGVGLQFAQCRGSSQAGMFTLLLNLDGSELPLSGPLYRVATSEGEAPSFGANVGGVVFYFEGSVRTGGDYGITAVARDTSQALPLQGASATLWGVPADPSHDAERFCTEDGNYIPGCSAGMRPQPLVTYPSRCDTGLLRFELGADSWENLGVFKTASFDHDSSGNPMTVTGCEKVTNFQPELELQPESRSAGAPTAVDVTLGIPQSNDPGGLSAALLRKATVTLPKGMTVNAASADGQAACSPGQIGIDNALEPTCPDASKIGSVEIESPLVEKPLKGSVYLATQGTNPFKSLLALYVVAQGYEQTIKLAGKVTPDPESGQLQVVFDETPQLPFNSMAMRFKGGSRASLENPTACGTYTTIGEFTSWSRPDVVVTSRSSFTVDANCGANGRFTPGFEAGTTNPNAGHHSPFTLRVTRPDVQQNVASIQTTLPEGVLAKLAGVPLCGDAEAGTGNCPQGSQVGTATVGTGAGTNPLYVPQPGKPATAVYLAGPYKGAPYSLVAKVPAQAGPFDLGTVAVRNTINIDPTTAQASVKSDPLPQILQGIPIAYRDIRVDVDRSKFTLNPTSCDPMRVEGTIGSAGGQSAAVSDRFQVANCASLAFKPKLDLRLSGAPPRRGGYPKLTATLTMPEGGANIDRAVVTMPKTQFLENAHIRTICTRVQYAAKACPEASVYGYAKAWTPLLDEPLQGPVYLRSSSNKLPDLVASLDGAIHVDLAGRIDSVNGRIRNTFESVPDAPVSKFVLTMQGGRKGLLVNNTNLCKAKPRASAQFDGQNGKISDSNPLVKVGGCGKKAKRQK